MKAKNGRGNGHLIKNTLLLKIHREFSHDEAVNLLEQEISKLKQEIGILTSEKAELQYENDQLRKMPPDQLAQLRRDEEIQRLEIELNLKNKESKKEKQDVELWRGKYFSLMSKVGLLKETT